MAEPKPGEKGSQYAVIKRRDGTTTVVNKFTGKPKTSKNTVVVGVKTSKSGVITEQVNVGKGLSEAQKRNVSELAGKSSGRLSSSVSDDTVTFTGSERVSSIYSPSSRASPSPLPTDQVRQGRILSEPFTPGQSARSVQQADPGFVGPRSAVEINNTFKRVTPGYKQGPQETTVINKEISFGTKVRQEPYFGSPGTVQPRANVVERFFSAQPESFKGSVGGEVARQVSNLGRDLVVGARELSPFSTVVALKETLQGKGEGNFYKRFQQNFEERKEKFKRETTTTATATAIGVGIAAAPLAAGAVGISAGATTKGLLGLGIAADIGFTGYETAKAFITPSNKQTAKAIVTGATGVLTTLPLVRASRAEQRATNILGETITKEKLSSSRELGIELSGSPQLGTITKIETIRTPDVEVGFGQASPVFGPPQLIKNTDIVSPDFLLEVRRTRTKVTPISGTSDNLPTTQLRTTTDLTSQGIITSDAAITKPKNVYRLGPGSGDVPVKIEQEGFVQYLTIEPASFKASKAYEDNIDDILALSMDNKRLSSRNTPKQIGFQPKIEYVRDFDNLGVIKITTDKQSFSLAVDKKTKSLVGELSDKPSIFKITGASASRGGAGFGGGKIITANDVIKKQSVNRNDFSSSVGGGSQQTMLVMEPPESVKDTTSIGEQINDIYRQKLAQAYKQKIKPQELKSDSMSIGDALASKTKEQFASAEYGSLSTATASKTKEGIVVLTLSKTKKATKTATKSKSKVIGGKLATISKGDLATSNKYAIANEYANISKGDTLVKTISLTKSATLSKTDSLTKSATLSKTDSFLRPDTRFDSLFKSGFSKTKTDTPLKKFPNIDLGKNFGSVFSVFVRRGGEFRRVGVARSQRQAFAIGSQVVGTSAAASFKVTSNTGGIVAPINIGKDFYVSGKETGVIIERKERRIKSGGELREITFKGVQAQKNKRRMVL